MTATKDKPLEGNGLDVYAAIAYLKGEMYKGFYSDEKDRAALNRLIRAAEENSALRARVKELENEVADFKKECRA